MTTNIEVHIRSQPG